MTKGKLWINLVSLTKGIPKIENSLAAVSAAGRGSLQTGQRAGRSRPAFLRVFDIHKYLLAGDYPNCSTLAREIEVTAKTIQRDLSFMRDQSKLPGDL